ncbi:DUF924 family protein [Aspergillus clavatus NRRL 1]|uniref:DUF924 domain protein n=1 Tax=Aspergillus clavatus (strain ATCC 1007 / CBS 513.65 / DSM 816 / NCTC 3887 / NRRL 1 / QM 1276 / 107) TaxID=344612 RepID=A1C5K4_ASPCL|nr:uncharacterized protein ACLA_003850 [Aspergillus clavatus NRRL 1]EAW14972.1 conserved hypothetical protein [Aspergillus clavatus NRRL 1]
MFNHDQLPLAQILTTPLLARIYDFWFQHTESDENLTLPTPADLKHWFFKSDDFDHACTSQYGSILAAIQNANPSAEQILSLANPTTPRDWLALLLLLDQLPRNCYRGPAARTVFEFFDPLALAIARKAEDAGIPRTPEIRYRLGLRLWFYLPLIHSEERSVQELARQRYAEMAEDVRRVLNGASEGAGAEAEREDVRTLVRNRDRAREQIEMSLRSQRDHYDPVARFGRFPHRNEAMGRQSTEEERRFVEEGGTFGQ